MDGFQIGSIEYLTVTTAKSYISLDEKLPLYGHHKYEMDRKEYEMPFL